MAQAHSYESTSNPTDRIDGTETQAPAADAFTDSAGRADSKSGPGNWGVAARWFILALLAIAFLICLNVVFR
jgi:hypothetical protein